MEELRNLISHKNVEMLKYFEINLYVGSLIQTFKCLTLS